MEERGNTLPWLPLRTGQMGPPDENRVALALFCSLFIRLNPVEVLQRVEKRSVGGGEGKLPLWMPNQTGTLSKTGLPNYTVGLSFFTKLNTL